MRPGGVADLSGQRLVVRVRRATLPPRDQGRYPGHDDLMCRQFTAGASNRLWLPDITEQPHRRGQAVCVRHGRIVHSDRGSQFRARKVQRGHDPPPDVGSTGRIGSAGGNAAMESSFALSQCNVVDRRRWYTRDELRIAIVTWIERTYHRRRQQAALGRHTPVEHEMITTPPATDAA
jgi:putative transposase